MDTVRARHGWWWLDEHRAWRWTRLRVVAAVRARRARRAEVELRLGRNGYCRGQWR